jgi:transcription elongation factor Elf1
MASRFASGKHAIAECDRCGQRFKLKELRTLVVKTRQVNILVCKTCWEPDQPQLMVGMRPVDDPQALRNPRPDNTYWQGGLTGLRLVPGGGPLGTGDPSGGSRIIQWGWAPVGGARGIGSTLTTPNNLLLNVVLGTVTVVTT